MASRPVFFPVASGTPGVRVEDVAFGWVAGMARSQRRKCVASLHRAIRERWPDAAVLEVSSKSELPLGVRLSAFNLGIHSARSRGFVCVESVYQCSKVFRDAGPFPQGYALPAREARALAGELGGQVLEAFDLHGERWPLVPRRAFYDWIYCQALARNPRLAESLAGFTCFTDIEFNPSRSVNCQAYAAALYRSLQLCGALRQALSGKEAFLSAHPAESGGVAAQTGARSPRGAKVPRKTKAAPRTRGHRGTKPPPEAPPPLTLFEQLMPSGDIPKGDDF